MSIRIGMPQMGNDLFRKYMKSKYVQSIKRSGGSVVWIDLEDPDAAASQILTCDGLLLPGGADVAPHLYGQTPSEKCGKPNTLRDIGEMKILEAFYPTGKPIFCICRGVQLMNVFFHGTLHQDIQDLQSCNHSDFKTRKKGCHSVTISPNTKLSAIIREKSMLVNSMHHQAVQLVGENLIVSAQSEDGITEAVEHCSHPFCIGVQWHPEHMSKENPRQQKLFDAFVFACKGGDSRD